MADQQCGPAAQPANREALRARYEAVRASAEERGALATLDAFEADLSQSRAVLGRSVREVDRLVASDREGYASYYQLVAAEARLPDDNQWDSLRRLADAALFPGYEQHSTCDSLRCRVFLGAQSVKLGDLDSALLGRRATYTERAALCIAKLGARLKPEPEDFVEVNIYGPVTIRTFEKVVVDSSRVRPKARLRRLRERLARFEVELEER